MGCPDEGRAEPEDCGWLENRETDAGRTRRNKGFTGIYNELHVPARRSLCFVVLWCCHGKLRVERGTAVEVRQ